MDEGTANVRKPRPLLDFLMCWLATWGLTNLGMGAVSLVYEMKHDADAQALTTNVLRLQVGIVFLAVSLGLTCVGLIHVLRRHRWRMPLSMVVFVMSFVCVTFGVGRMLTMDRPRLIGLAMIAVTVSTLGYSAWWSRMWHRREQVLRIEAREVGGG